MGGVGGAVQAHSLLLLPSQQHVANSGALSDRPDAAAVDLPSEHQRARNRIHGHLRPRSRPVQRDDLADAEPDDLALGESDADASSSASPSPSRRSGVAVSNLWNFNFFVIQGQARRARAKESDDRRFARRGWRERQYLHHRRNSTSRLAFDTGAFYAQTGSHPSIPDALAGGDIANNP